LIRQLLGKRPQAEPQSLVLVSRVSNIWSEKMTLLLAVADAVRLNKTSEKTATGGLAIFLSINWRLFA